jgi:tRNA-dihydrouridine synthase
MFTPLQLKNILLKNPLFLAPLAGVTNSAFRRLVAGFGGYGALFTEMLSGKALLGEHVGHTPFTKKRQEEGIVWYQLALNGTEDIPRVLDKLICVSPLAIDLNAGCPAPEMERVGTGVSLFADLERFTRVVKGLRKGFDGVFTVKCRLWETETGWQNEFLKRLRIIEDNGADAIIVHPRFFGEKLKRNARWEHFSWIKQHTKLPLIANGDIGSVADIRKIYHLCTEVSGYMIGRLAVVRPWIFRDIANEMYGYNQTFDTINYINVWETFYKYVMEDFRPEKAIGRLKEFSKYYSRNFFFGHQLKTMTQCAASCEMINDVAMTFLTKNPQVVENPSVTGI